MIIEVLQAVRWSICFWLWVCLLIKARGTEQRELDGKEAREDGRMRDDEDTQGHNALSARLIDLLLESTPTVKAA